MFDALEMQVVERFRWWLVVELAHAVERLTPLALADWPATSKKARLGTCRRPRSLLTDGSKLQDGLPNNTLDRTAGSHALAAAGQRESWTASLRERHDAI